LPDLQCMKLAILRRRRHGLLFCGVVGMASASEFLTSMRLVYPVGNIDMSERSWDACRQ
jgi:hypothetical protein